MKSLNLSALKNFLRSPRLIIAEIAGIALAGVLGAVFPQAGVDAPEKIARLHDSGPFISALVQTLALDHVFRSPQFLALTLLAAASLAIIIVEQAKRLRAQWTKQLAPAHFRDAPFQIEFERPNRGQPVPDNRLLWTERRLGLAGSPLIHTGLLLVILAGAFRALFGADAAVDLLEGETLAPNASVWPAQWPGALARNFSLQQPVTLKKIQATRYDEGDLRDLKVSLEIHQDEGVRPAEVGVNRDLRLAGERLFVTSQFGPAALLEWRTPSTAPKREAVLLTQQPLRKHFEGSSSGPNGLRAYVRAQVDETGHAQDALEIRVMKVLDDGRDALLFTGDARVGQTCMLPGGLQLALCGTPCWLRLRGSRDCALGLAYLGFALVIAGVTIIFMIVKVDACVIVTPLEGREKIFIALKPQRFAPLFHDKFQRLVHEALHPLTPSSPHPVTSQENLSPAPHLVSALLLLITLCGCQRASFDQARKLVEHYNQIVSEAYRRGDIKLVDGVVGPNEGRKLTGLIGVRLDTGLTLDSHLLALEVTGVEKSKALLRVQTRERWRYRDLKIGTGQQVGEVSEDSYEMLYLFKKIGYSWVMDEIRFSSPPQIGRKQTPWVAMREAMHAMAGTQTRKDAPQP